MATVKKCSRCSEIKSITEFTKLKASKDGHAPHCRSCAAIYKARHKERDKKVRAKRDLFLKSREVISPMKESKKCPKCHEIKSVNDFHVLKTSLDGLQSKCKKCTKLFSLNNAEKINEKSRNWYLNNRDRRLSVGRKWREDNREKALEISKNYRKNNKEKVYLSIKEWKKKNKDWVLLKQKEWVNRNKEKCLEKARRYRERNPEKLRAQCAKYCANKINATPIWADHKKIQEFYKLSQKLTKETGIQYHVDHIVPLRSNAVCGLHWEKNLQVIPMEHNCSKSNKFDVGAPIEITGMVA